MNLRNTNLDLIKSIACIMVVGLHSVGMTDYTFYYFFTFGVPLFFMVNGYLMFNKESVSFIYSLKKIAGILKIIVAWNLIILIPMMILKKQFLNPLTYIFKSTLQLGYLWHFWFFGSLILLYLFLPVIHALLKNRLKLHIVLCLLLFLVSQIITVISCFDGYPRQAFIPQTLRLWTWLFYYLTGALFAKINIRVKHMLPLSLLTLGLIIISNLGQKHLGNYMYHMRNAEFFYDIAIVILCSISIFILIMNINIPANLSKYITNLSNLSLGIFIVHPLFLKAGTTILNAVFNISINKTATALLLWVVTVIISYIISLIISKLPYINSIIRS